MGAVPVRTGSVGRSGRLRRDPPLRALCRCRRRVRWRVTARPAGLLWLATSVVLTCAAVGAAVVLAPRAGGSPDAGLAWMLFVGSSVHVAATGWLFTDPGLRAHVAGRRSRYLWAPVGLLATGALLAVTLNPRTMAWVLLPLLAWQLHHFQKQNLGQAALVTASLGLSSLRPHERRAICTTGAAGIAGVCAHPALLQLDVRLPLSGYLALAATLLLALGVAAGSYALARRPGSDRPATFCAVYGLALLFPLPIFLFTSPYAAVAGMTMAHGLQYLLLMGLLAAGTASSSPRRGACPVGDCRLGRDGPEPGLPSAQLELAPAPLLRVLSRISGRALRRRRRHLAPP